MLIFSVFPESIASAISFIVFHKAKSHLALSRALSAIEARLFVFSFLLAQSVSSAFDITESAVSLSLFVFDFTGFLSHPNGFFVSVLTVGSLFTSFQAITSSRFDFACSSVAHIANFHLLGHSEMEAWNFHWNGH